jgi:hypothetical protein
MRNSILVSRQESISTLDLSHIPLLNERTLFFYTKHIQDGRKMPLPTFRFILLDVNLFFFFQKIIAQASKCPSKQANLSTYAGIPFFFLGLFSFSIPQFACGLHLFYLSQPFFIYIYI